MGEISPGLFKEFPKEVIAMLTNLFNTCFGLGTFPKCLKTAQNIVAKNLVKLVEQVASQRPVSLLILFFKLFEKLKCMKPMIIISDVLFGVVIHIDCALEKKYCSVIILDFFKAFDRKWHQSLIHNMVKLLPGNYCELLMIFL